MPRHSVCDVQFSTSVTVHSDSRNTSRTLRSTITIGIFIVIVVIFTCEVVSKILVHCDKFVVQKIIIVSYMMKLEYEQSVFLEQDVDSWWDSVVTLLTRQGQGISLALKCPDHPWYPLNLLFSGYQGSFSGSKVAGA